jgi:hypothetical protein
VRIQSPPMTMSWNNVTTPQHCQHYPTNTSYVRNKGELLVFVLRTIDVTLSHAALCLKCAFHCDIDPLYWDKRYSCLQYWYVAALALTSQI